jgi:TatD DNase family protein
MVDAHAHLTDDRLVAELDGVLERAAAAGVTRILTCGEDLASSEAAVALARRNGLVRAAVGVHPHRAETAGAAAMERLRALARDERVVAIGEIGIDLGGRSAPQDAQERAFAAQLALAAELGLPVVVHVRESGSLTRRVLAGSAPVRGHVHCYSEGVAEIGDWVDLGFFVSFAGTLTYPRNVHLREAARAVPEDRLLLETDSPYLAPEPHRGRRNEPALIVATYAAAARARGVEPARLAEVTAANAAALFGSRW